MKKLKIIISIFAVTFYTASIRAQSIDWMPLGEAQTLASENNKKVMVYAEAEWCGYCKKMNRTVFPEKSVQDNLSKYFYPVRIDIESHQKVTFNGKEFTEQNLAREFRVSGTPTVIFLDAGGKIIGVQPGYLPTKIFDKLLAFVGNDLTGSISFKTYLKEHGIEINQ
jgi:thioredoxin-related protein